MPKTDFLALQDMSQPDFEDLIITLIQIWYNFPHDSEPEAIMENVVEHLQKTRPLNVDIFSNLAAPATEKVSQTRSVLIKLRDGCLGPTVFDPSGAVLLSHAVRCLSFLEKGEPYAPATD